ncbi:MAG: DUF2116 family Zn-ribbon domain-containing protein [Archaeoglobales archaeon]|nr:MAG: DUF2116 family Zn-ribbon domain-containing protein [Archaeoglobales archaeon]
MPGIVPHRHCLVCGKAIEPDKNFCSDDCKVAWEKERKRQRNFSLMMLALLMILLFFIIFTPR